MDSEIAWVVAATLTSLVAVWLEYRRAANDAEHWERRFYDLEGRVAEIDRWRKS